MAFLDSNGVETLSSAIKQEVLNTIVVGATSSTAGEAGLVPSPGAGDNTKFLRGDGTWQVVSGGGSAYELPTASATIKGGIKVGDGLTMTGEVLSVDQGWATLLWTNASPTSSFAGQSVALDSDGSAYDTYDAYLVIALEFNSSDRHTSEIIFKDVIGAIHCWASTNNNRNGQRTVNVYKTTFYASYGTMMQFQACEYNGSINNSYCIPYKIYGLKLVNS